MRDSPPLSSNHHVLMMQTLSLQHQTHT